MTAKITRDKVASVIKAVSDLATKDVLVGIPDSAPERKDGEPISNAQIGYIQEHGAPAANIPARPFLVPGVRDAQDKIGERLGKGAKAALNGQDQAEQTLNAAGLIGQNAARAKINSNIQPKLADSTIAARLARGVTRTNTLVDTGQLRNSITYVVRNKT
ncbi:putative bacteriophage protein [Burkholderia sp. 8Y]|uniref:hypothetical protein n=1 Tax=Burkholderia sp. 8Y TaxID=2653133 RepID=UPI0012F18C02|nr:hypothetical protein [Burkholderia sp. 8Y]VXB24879.1 putative bacteriophage protein [Burkholderia sp. 8Y]